MLGYADAWTGTAIDADTKLLLWWYVGKRTAEDVAASIEDLAGRLGNHVQLRTDGLKVYVNAVDGAFGTNIGYAMLVKPHSSDPDAATR